MPPVHRLSRREARRIAVRAQALSAKRPRDLLDVLRRLSLLQIDPTKAIAPSADLVLWSRLGSAYSREDLVEAIDTQAVLEYRGTLRPAEDLALYRADMAAWPGGGRLKEWQESLKRWVRANDGCRRDILDRLRADGPLLSRDLPDTCERPWRSTGWTNHKNVTQLLGLMAQRGEVAVAGREGRERLWDLAERVYPDEPIPSVTEAARLREERRLRALGIARERAAQSPVEPLGAGLAGEPAVVDGVRGEWRVDPTQLGQPFRGRAALLSPFDRLLHDRKRVAELFEFDYILEMFKPVAQRQWGYYALPVLDGDRLVGKLDATAEPAEGELRVRALHWDVSPSQAMIDAVDREIADLAVWLGVTRVDDPG